MNKKLLILADIHGRKFWKNPCHDIEKYDKVIFLGDYLDSYDFENISVQECIENFKEIIEFKKANSDKVVLLLGNHDYPYYSDEYFGLSRYHCRHSNRYHDDISKLFKDNKDCFQLAYAEGDILFTHAGVDGDWLRESVGCSKTDINEICHAINMLKDDVDGQKKLHQVTYSRGGYDQFGSCVWADVNDIKNGSRIPGIKQVFGHTLQAFYDKNMNIVFGNAVEFDDCKMLDNARPYELDVNTFTIKEV